MATASTWWSAVAPYWRPLEDLHAKELLDARFLGTVAGPALVVGARQGVIVERLATAGIAVSGLEPEDAMIERAAADRGLAIGKWAPPGIPHPDGAFRTVIVAPGAVDLLEDRASVESVLAEARRVLAPYGNLYVAFYQLAPALAEHLRRIGALSADGGRLHLKEIVAHAARRGSTRVGRRLCFAVGARRAVQNYLERFERVVALAAAASVEPVALAAAAPDFLPYRDEAAVGALLQDLPFSTTEIRAYPGAVVARYYKSSLAALKGTPHADPAPAAQADWIIRTEGLSKQYRRAGRKAVDDLSLVIGKGSIHGVLGPNGAGKTTTLSMLSGLLKPDRGAVSFAPELRGRRIREAIGYVPQELAVYTRLSAVDNIRFFGSLYGIHGARLAGRADELLDMVGLADRAGDLVSSYSTGMMRRLNLAIGLVHEPSLILLDEPTVGIDPQSRNCIFEAVLDLKRRGVTILYTTHYMEEASKLCDRIAILDHGKVILEGDPRAAVAEYGLYRVELEIGGESGAFAERLRALPSVFEVQRDGGALTVLARDGSRKLETLAAVKDLADRTGVGFTLKNVVDPTLESLFLDITGKRLRDGAEEGA